MKNGGFRPGAGRKKAPHTIEAEKAREYITKRVSEELEPIITKAIEQAKAGDATARRDLMDRAYGKPTESMDVTSGGKPIPILNALLPNNSDKKDSDITE